jgi:hypothetical protein
MQTVKAWSYFCRDENGKYTILAQYANFRKPYGANPVVRVRIVKESDWKKMKGEK